MDFTDKLLSSFIAFEDMVNVNDPVHEIRTEALKPGRTVRVMAPLIKARGVFLACACALGQLALGKAQGPAPGPGEIESKGK